MLGQSLLYENNIHKDYIAILASGSSIKIVRFCSADRKCMLTHFVSDAYIGHC